jgi:hypothetical protein
VNFSKTQPKIPFSSAPLKKLNLKKKHERLFQDQVILYVVQNCSPSLAVQWAKMQRLRGVTPMCADRHHAWRIVRSLAEVLKDKHDHLAKNCFAQQISFDDATGKDSREWCGIILGVDSTRHPENKVTSNFFFGLLELDFKGLSAEGMFLKIATLKIDWSKIFFIGRDGAAVMIALVDLIIARLAPHAIGVYCGNHNCQLLLKDCFFGIPEFSFLVDSLHDVWTFCKYSTKSMSRLNELTKNLKGPKKPKRANKLTRWSAVLNATNAVMFLLPFFLQIWIDILTSDKNLKAEQKDKVSKLLKFWCDWRNIVLTAVMNFVGKFFVDFHLELQRRSADFSIVEKQLKILKTKVGSCLDGVESTKIAVSVETLLSKCKNLKHFAAVAKIVDFEVKLKDATKSIIAAHVFECSNTFVGLFYDNVDLRFPDDNNEIVSSFRMFDPETFPDLSVIDDNKEKDRILNAFGRTKLKVLCDHYGEEKKKEDGSIERAKIDSDLAQSQWGEFVQEYREWRGDGMKNFRQLARKILKLEKTQPVFAVRFSEIIKLIKIAEVYPSSTAEVERLFSAMKKTVTDQRTTISPINLESCMMISTEARRLYPGKEISQKSFSNKTSKKSPEIWRIVEMLPEISEKLREERKRHSQGVRKAQKVAARRQIEELKENEPSAKEKDEVVAVSQNDRPALPDEDDDVSDDFRDAFGSSDDSFDSLDESEEDHSDMSLAKSDDNMNDSE